MKNLLHDAKQIEEEFIVIRRQIHEFPETAFEEWKTSALIAEKLSSCGIEVMQNGDKTGVIGILRGAKEGKTVALRADIDALPVSEKTGLSYDSKREGKCHACGHDLHTAALLEAARLLSDRRDKLSGTVKFVFQPAEEQLNGAPTILESGFLQDVDVIFGAHSWPALPVGTVGIRRGTMMAGADRFKITIHAAGGHAAHPEKTADPIIAVGYIITQLQMIVARELKATDAAVITVGKIRAGETFNTIPSEAVLEGTVRCLSPDVQLHIRESVKRIADCVARSVGATATTEYINGCPPLMGTPDAVDTIERAAEMLLGKGKVVALEEPSLGSEDFAYYLQRIPGAFIRIGTADERKKSRLGLHNPEIVFNEDAISIGAVTLAMTALLYTESDIE